MRDDESAAFVVMQMMGHKVMIMTHPGAQRQGTGWRSGIANTICCAHIHISVTRIWISI